MVMHTYLFRCRCTVFDLRQVLQPIQTVDEDVHILVVGPKRSLNRL